MKQKKVNNPGDPFRHTVTHAPAMPLTGTTYAARCSVKMERGKVTFAWRVFPQQAPRRKVK